MSLTWPAKDPDTTLDFTWEVPLDDGDSLTDATLELISGTAVIESKGLDGAFATWVISGGTAGEVNEFKATATTAAGREPEETIYLAIGDSNGLIADTARDYCAFALTKIPGIGNDADAAELDLAIKCLNGMLAEWKASGADVGAAFPITANTPIRCPEWMVSAIRYNLMIAVYPFFGAEMAPQDVMAAKRGLGMIKQVGLPDERATDYF